MGGKASKTREREVVYARLPHGGAAGSAAAVSTGGAAAAAELTSSISAGARARATLNAQTKQSRDARTRSREKQKTPRGARESRGTVAYSQNSKPSRPWTPQPPASPHSTTFTVSTADSLRLNGRASRRLSSSSSSSSSRDVVEPPPSKPTTKITMSDHHNNHASHAYGSGHVQRLPENERRIIEAEKILEEIAKEYAAKRAAGLVPTKPVPARTLLWEELARNRTQAGRRGQCIFGRDTDNICGCTTYKKKRVPGQENTGGVCECCNHGAVWHRLVGGTMARSSRMSRSIIGSSVRASRLESAASSYVPSEARSSAYDYDSDEDYDDDEDDEAIANEIAVPSSFYPVQAPAPPPPALQSQSSSSQGGMDRLSLLSIGSSYGFPSRLSSATNSLGALLQAIQRYRDMGLDEDEIEVRIRQDFPPVPRKSSVAARSDTSMSPVDI